MVRLGMVKKADPLTALARNTAIDFNINNVHETSLNG